MVVDSVANLCSQSIFLRIGNLLPHGDVHLKVEGLNAAGSIKLKTARQILDDLQDRGILRLGCSVIESSSGNLGLALASLCAERGYSFTCVSDPNISPPTQRMITALGGHVIIVNHRDPEGGYLKTRLDLIRAMISRDPNLVWTDQYSNRSNALAHYRTTGAEILAEFPSLDWVFIGAGTTGTLAGASHCIRERSARTRIVAVDSVGSVTFGGASSTRHLPGMGTSCRPPLADDCIMDQLEMVLEEDAIHICHRLARQCGLLIGPSTGSVLAAVVKNSKQIAPNATVVAVSPDLGDRYTETLYDHDWIRTRFPSINDLSQPPVPRGTISTSDDAGPATVE